MDWLPDSRGRGTTPKNAQGGSAVTPAAASARRGKRIASIVARCRKAGTLTVQPLGEGRYLVSGGEEPHRVSAADRAHPHCDCEDHRRREGRTCAHLVAVLLFVGVELEEIVERMRAEEVARG